MMDLHQDVDKIVYLDNAATVYPKPREVLDGMVELYHKYGVNPGRSGYDLCLVGGEYVQTTRQQLTRFFGGSDPERLVFAYNASDALNILIYGLVAPGDHVVTTNLEHNSVIRPLNHLARDREVRVDFVPFEADGRVDPERIAAAITDKTKLVACNHGSNVIGTIQPVAEIGRICRDRGVLFCIDTAQTAGVVPIDVESMCVDALAFTGHKSLLGPTGIGGLYVRDGVEVRHSRAGGTGVKSAYPYHLDEYPYRLEVGTANVLGIVGLHLAQSWIEARGMSAIYAHEMALFERLENGLAEIEGLRLYGARGAENRLPCLSFTVDGFDPSDVSTILDVDYNVACRTGLQCAPLVHEQVGTSPRGTVRLSCGPMNRDSDVDTALDAMKDIAERAAKARAV